MKLGSPPGYLGCIVAPGLILLSLWVAHGAWSLWSWYKLTDPQHQVSLLNNDVDRFSCDDLRVTRRVKPYHNGDPWGAFLVMSDECRSDLRQRARRSVVLEEAGDCFFRDSRFASIELCFADEGVYYGGYRVK